MAKKTKLKKVRTGLYRLKRTLNGNEAFLQTSFRTPAKPGAKTGSVFSKKEAEALKKVLGGRVTPAYTLKRAGS